VNTKGKQLGVDILLWVCWTRSYKKASLFGSWADLIWKSDTNAGLHTTLLKVQHWCRLKV